MSDAIVLCGGAGTRLRSVLSNRPKALAPIGDRVFLDLLLSHLKRNGVSRAVLAAGLMGDQVEEHVAGREGVDVVREPSPLGTGGGFAYAMRESDVQQSFFGLNGDTWFDGSLSVLGEAHERARRHGALATLALVRVDDRSRYGGVHFDEDSRRVMRFEEKDPLKTEPGWISVGVYRLEPEALAEVETEGPVSMEHEVFPQLVRRRQLYACPFDDATFLDYGTPEDYARAADVIPQEDS